LGTSFPSPYRGFAPGSTGSGDPVGGFKTMGAAWSEIQLRDFGLSTRTIISKVMIFFNVK